MKISNALRVKKLISNLTSNPDLIYPYLKHNVFNKKYPVELELPWWSYRAIQYVDSIVGGKNIFEYGTGGSTLRFSNKAKSITAVEDDAQWTKMLLRKIKDLNIKNVDICYTPFDFHNPAGFETSDYLKKVDSGAFDILIIDGQDWTFNERITCFKYVEPRMQKGQYIIVDDFWRYEELYSIHNAKELKVFESVGPCRYGVTSTAVFLY